MCNRYWRMLPVPSLKMAQLYPRIPPGNCYQHENVPTCTRDCNICSQLPNLKRPRLYPRMPPEDAQPKDAPPGAEDVLTVTNPRMSQPRCPVSQPQDNPTKDDHICRVLKRAQTAHNLKTVFRIRIRILSVFNQVSGFGSGSVFGIRSRRAKMTHKSRIFFKNLMF